MKCCQIDCPVTAEYRIEWGQVANPDNYTEACEGHVGALLGHHPHQPAPEHYRVYPIGSSPEEPSGKVRLMTETEVREVYPDVNVNDPANIMDRNGGNS